MFVYEFQSPNCDAKHLTKIPPQTASITAFQKSPSTSRFFSLGLRGTICETDIQQIGREKEKRKHNLDFLAFEETEKPGNVVRKCI